MWLSQREQDGLKAGTLISETASEALVGRTAEVRVPWGSLQVTVSEPIEETEDGRRAGHDASLVGVQVALDGPEDLLVADRLPDGALQDPTFTLVADEEEYLLDGLTGWVEDNQVAEVARRQYVAVKGEPSRISLRVGYDGVDQVVDALTGDVDRNAAGPLYELGFASGAQPCGDPLWSPGASDVGENVTSCVVTSSAQRPYVAGLGWAPEGRSWMVVTVLTGRRPSSKARTAPTRWTTPRRRTSSTPRDPRRASRSTTPCPRGRSRTRTIRRSSSSRSTRTGRPGSSRSARGSRARPR